MYSTILVSVFEFVQCSCCNVVLLFFRNGLTLDRFKAVFKEVSGLPTFQVEGVFVFFFLQK